MRLLPRQFSNQHSQKHAYKSRYKKNEFADDEIAEKYPAYLIHTHCPYSGDEREVEFHDGQPDKPNEGDKESAYDYDPPSRMHSCSEPVDDIAAT